MNYVGDFDVGANVFIWYNTFSSNDPSASVTTTDLVDTDVHIYKDDSLTQRNNAAGVAVDVDVDTFAGVHKITIDTADNTVANFYEAGHDYAVVVEGTTVDSGTINACVGTFSIANRRTAGQMCVSSIEAYTDTTHFTLTTGEASADNDAYNGCIIVVTDQVTKIQKGIGHISDYTGATRAVVLHAAPLCTNYTWAVGDSVEILATSAFANVNTVGQTTQTANDNGADINDILTDTAAQDTTTKIRTLLTGADTPVCKDSTPLTAAETESECNDALVALNLDHLLKVTTGVAADGDLSSHVVDQTVMSHLLTATADTDKFKASTDSLEAIKVHADTIKAETAVLNAFWNVFILTSGTIGAVGNDTTHLHLTGQGYGNDELNDYILVIYDNSEAEYHSVWITDWVLATALATVETMAFTPQDSVDTYWVFSLKKHPAVATILADTNEVQTDLANGGRLDLLIDAIKVVTDNQAAASTTLIEGTVSWDNTNATTTVIYSDDITEATADHYNGRLFVPTSGALLGQYTDITDYALDAGEGKFTVTALTEAPADNTTFVII